MEITIEKNRILIYWYNTDTICYLNSLRNIFNILNIVVYDDYLSVKTEKSEMYRLLYTITNDLWKIYRYDCVKMKPIFKKGVI